MEAERHAFVPVGEFVAIDEPGAEALLGTVGDVLIPEGGDVMVYGDGGAGKTTLTLDLAFHLAAGTAWCGIPIAKAVSCGIVENEGPRPLFRRKVRDKYYGWDGAPVDDRLVVLEKPWATFTFVDELHRAWLAEQIDVHELDVVILGPLTRLGMNEAGTLQETRDFAGLLEKVRANAHRPVTFLLVHHENKGGQVSGAWEGAGDTLLHVQAQGHGRTRIVFQKARWASAWHGKALQLVWADGESFTVEDKPDVDDNTVADTIVAAARANPGCSWNVIEKDHVRGNKARAREIRDQLLAGGQLVDANGDRPGKVMALYDATTHGDQLRLGSDAGETHPDTPPDALAAPGGHYEGVSLRPDTDTPRTHHAESEGVSGASALRKDAPPDTDTPADDLDRLASLGRELGLA